MTQRDYEKALHALYKQEQAIKVRRAKIVKQYEKDFLKRAKERER